MFTLFFFNCRRNSVNIGYNVVGCNCILNRLKYHCKITFSSVLIVIFRERNGSLKAVSVGILLSQSMRR